MEKTALTPTQLKAIHYILESNSIREAAKKVRVSRGTLYNWMREESFNERLKKERQDLFNWSLSLLKQATQKAVNELINLLNSKDETTRRLTAKEIINLSLRTIEIKQLEERITEIEQIIEQKYQSL